MLRQSAGDTLSLDLRRESTVHDAINRVALPQSAAIVPPIRHPASPQRPDRRGPFRRSNPGFYGQPPGSVPQSWWVSRRTHSRSTHTGSICRKIPTLRQRTRSGRRLAALPPWENPCCCPAAHCGTLVSAGAGPSRRRIRPTNFGVGFDSSRFTEAPDRGRQAIVPRASGCAGGSVVARLGR